MPREINIPAQTVQEEIRMITEVTGSVINVMVGKVDASGEFIVPQQFETYDIKEDNFTDLMSANPSWAPNKPAGTYRNEDLWHFIDIIRGQQNA